MNTITLLAAWKKHALPVGGNIIIERKIEAAYAELSDLFDTDADLKLDMPFLHPDIKHLADRWNEAVKSSFYSVRRYFEKPDRRLATREDGFELAAA